MWFVENYYLGPKGFGLAPLVQDFDFTVSFGPNFLKLI